ncbi:dihydrolipoyllysine-residue acetyltransferase [Halorhodospira halochloris]|uniref:Acetyltransferase component of pyruvate dehydrogenase complex n=1 Tax=Halorhodospira halochloris TaxID=1052 RepID=A0A110B4H6_HALHR|nr:dihydrolipoyllysine-residue acetyltransferase [Halorhodospira halochloris]MBK1650962.1 dihydrolipoyllysine-residue acetyltransferase [Halorhodospira halochloris]MCG5529328.1 dihydrolipoyllysine-residue acetyltransferase [Halorhodospira halochloris]MCG5547304.1 dihydrolipoyllysine-residue acetyltransferase [Halorhodospira halochloris]BAU56532.1 dihydrolipoamide acetyltransferase component of pyruvate dehydrogenase complex [Halorhodospira halochloris]
MAVEQVKVPDIGDFADVEIIEVLVAPGDVVAPEQSLITLESDKASMEVPSSAGGVVQELHVGVGDRVSEGSVILTLDTAAAAESQDSATVDSGQAATGASEQAAATPSAAEESASAGAAATPQAEVAASPESSAAAPASEAAGASDARIDRERHRAAHASPAVRRYARELGVDLGLVSGSGRYGRIRKDDVQAFVKQTMQQAAATSAAPGPAAEGTASGAIPPLPEIDFSQFGEVERVPLTRIQRLSGPHLHRSWLNVPHVTQFDEADITELESFRKSMQPEAENRGVKLTPLAFLVKAVSAALHEMPRFNSSLAADGQELIVKKYCNIGVAVDTPDGLVVPVLRGVDGKGVMEIAAELGEISQKARQGKLSSADMQGGCFTISSLGGIGGTAFTPIVNAPEVAILGASRSATKPVWNGKEFEPRLMLPLSLSYDHRVIDGAMAARFTNFLAKVLGDLRRLVL